MKSQTEIAADARFDNFIFEVNEGCSLVDGQLRNEKDREGDNCRVCGEKLDKDIGLTEAQTSTCPKCGHIENTEV